MVAQSAYRPDLVSLTSAARAVLAAAVVAGGRPLIVGGAVRDALLGTAPRDIDIEVHGDVDPRLLRAEFAQLGRVDERGSFFGIIAVQVGAEQFDVTVDHTGSTERAFARRDFTMNALGWDAETGELIDLVGGVDDLQAGLIRHTSAAFADDPLRVFRAMRFVGRFGFTLAPETVSACREVSALLAQHPEMVFRERIWAEWRSLARTGTHWVAALQALEDTGAVDMFPELAATRTVAQDARWHAEGDVWTHSGLAAEQAAMNAQAAALGSPEREAAVLGALVHDFGKVTHSMTEADGRITSRGHAGAGVAPATAFLDRIGAPANLIRMIAPLVREHMYHVGIDRPSRVQVRRLLRRLDASGAGPSIYDWARVVDADCAGRGISSKPSPAADWLAVAATTEVGDRPRAGLLTGDHLISLGMTPGPHFAVLLTAALEAQDEGEFADLCGALAWASERVAR